MTRETFELKKGKSKMNIFDKSELPFYPIDIRDGYNFKSNKDTPDLRKFHQPEVLPNVNSQNLPRL